MPTPRSKDRPGGVGSVGRECVRDRGNDRRGPGEPAGSLSRRSGWPRCAAAGRLSARPSRSSSGLLQEDALLRDRLKNAFGIPFSARGGVRRHARSPGPGCGVGSLERPGVPLQIPQSARAPRLPARPFSCLRRALRQRSGGSHAAPASSGPRPGASAAAAEASGTWRSSRSLYGPDARAAGAVRRLTTA